MTKTPYVKYFSMKRNLIFFQLNLIMFGWFYHSIVKNIDLTNFVCTEEFSHQKLFTQLSFLFNRWCWHAGQFIAEPPMACTLLQPSVETQNYNSRQRWPKAIQLNSYGEVRLVDGLSSRNCDFSDCGLCSRFAV